MFRHAVAVEPGSWYRVDTASGSSTPTSVLQPDGVTTVPNAYGLTGSTVRNGSPQGQAVFLSTVQTLYLKRLTYQGALSGDTPITSTGRDVTPVPDPSPGSDVAAILAAVPGRRGGVAGTAAAALPYFNVRDYGAVGDSVTHPLSGRFATLAAAQAVYPHATSLSDEVDWCAIQAALNAAAARPAGRWLGAYKVVIPAGEYIVNRTLDLARLTGMRIEGEGPAITAIRLSTALPAEDPTTGRYGLLRAAKNLGPSYNWSIRGLTLAGDEFGAPYTDANTHGLVLYGGEQTGVVENVVITKFGGYALLADTAFCSFRDCWFHDCATGIAHAATASASEGVTQSLFDNCHFENTLGRGVTAQECTFVKCHFEFSQYGVYNAGTRANILTQCGFVGNQTSAPAGTAMMLAGVYGPNDLVRCRSTGAGKLYTSNRGRELAEAGGVLDDITYTPRRVAPDYVKAVRSSSPITLNSATWADVDTGHTMDLTVGAAAGDRVELGINALLGNQGIAVGFDFWTVVSGSALNQCGWSGGDPPGGWYPQASVFATVTGILPYTVQAGDVVAGQVTFRLRYKTDAANDRTLYNSATIWARNVG